MGDISCAVQHVMKTSPTRVSHEKNQGNASQNLTQNPTAVKPVIRRRTRIKLKLYNLHHCHRLADSSAKIKVGGCTHLEPSTVQQVVQ